MIDQLTVFLENEKGRLAAACRTIADSGIDMHALFVADTTEFGVARIFCDTPHKAADALREAGYRASVTPVVAVHVPNRVGGLADLLEFCDSKNINIEYGYCFSVGKQTAIDVLKVSSEVDVEKTLLEAHFNLVRPEEIYQAD